ncbi:MAG: SelT/SelW/SelH family protein [Anaerolineae bacterium]|nr:SelT/SelW/SelH family protein [Anaerolineae bacterium]
MQIQKHRVTIKYCVPCDYSEHALRVAGELIRNYQHAISELVFEMSSGGVFEVKVDDEILFSKKEVNRHPEPGEVFGVFQQYVGKELPLYPRG